MSRKRLLFFSILFAFAGLLLLRQGREGDREASDGLDALQPEALMPAPTPTPPWMDAIVALALPVEPSGSAPVTGAYAIALAPFDDPEARLRLPETFEAVGRLAWSPDGNRLAFAARRDANWDLYLVDRDGGGLRRLTRHPEYDAWPAWSPDGGQLAFMSYRGSAMGIYRVMVPEHSSEAVLAADVTPGTDSSAAADAASAVTGDTLLIDEPLEVLPIVQSEVPAIEPAWSPDGQAIVYAAWREGAFRLERLRWDAQDAQPAPIRAETGRVDQRAPAFSPDGRHLSYLRRRDGQAQLVAAEWDAATATVRGFERTLASEATDYDWFPDHDALLIGGRSGWRQARRMEMRGLDGARRSLPAPPDGAGALAWTRGPLPDGRWVRLSTTAAGASARPGGNAAVGNAGQDGAAGSLGAPLGLARLEGVSAPGPRINAGLHDEYQAMRGELRAAVGQDFLGTLSDSWRPLGFQSSGSAFFSWHKTGRAFDTQMEMRGPGGRRDMILVREDAGGRTMWRMYLRAAVQDGSVGEPLFDSGWTFSAAEADSDTEVEREGGKRATRLPAGYWVDFTALAERYGWHRIPSITRSGFDWRRNWTAIEYWHYERRDDLRWFDAISQIYEEEELAEVLDPAELRARNVRSYGFSRLGFPPGWPGR